LLCACLFLIICDRLLPQIDSPFFVLSETYFLQNSKRKRKKGIPPLPRKKVAATTQPAIADAAAPLEIAATVASTKETKNK